MKLYIITICGFKFYFLGDLTPEAINVCECVCLRLKMDGKADNARALYERLISYMVSELEQAVTPIAIEHIFRVNY